MRRAAAAMICLAAALAALNLHPPALFAAPPPVRQAPGALPEQAGLSAAEIVARAHAAAGGLGWVRPTTAHFRGEAVFYRDGAVDHHERYEMWRVFPQAKADAHQADGRVRIQSWRNGETALLLAFDGARSYTAAGPQAPSAADRQWAENFGFGVIRFALDPGFTLKRLPDDLVDGRPAFVIDVADAEGGRTQFAFDRETAAILRVGFRTERGWHERIYSDFFRVEGPGAGAFWVQPGRVRLFYDGVKQNEVFWREVSLGEPMPESLFKIDAPK